VVARFTSRYKQPSFLVQKCRGLDGGGVEWSHDTGFNLVKDPRAVSKRKIELEIKMMASILRRIESRQGFPRYLRGYSTKQESKLWRQRPNKTPRLKIILSQDVPKLGVKGQIVKVKHGRGRNHLLPHKIAVYATPQNVARYNAFEVKEEKVTLTQTERIINFLEGKCLTIVHHPSDKSAIFEQHISRAFHRLQLNVPLNCIELDEPITDFGCEHLVTIRIDDETIAKVPVVIKRIVEKKDQERLDKLQSIPQEENLMNEESGGELEESGEEWTEDQEDLNSLEQTENLEEKY